MLRRISVVIAAALTSTAVGASVGSAPAHAATTTPDYNATTAAALPFVQPSQATLRASTKKVFANWVTALPISMDNKDPQSDYYATQYLTPDGENGSHAAYGGYLRDRPLGRAPIASSDWQLQDMETEVRQAISEGIDGFEVVIYSMPSVGNQQSRNAELMLQAAKAVDPAFSIILMPDMTVSAIAALTPQAMAGQLAPLLTYSNNLHDGGKVVVAPYEAEVKDSTYWNTFVSTLGSTYSQPTTLYSEFLDERPYEQSFKSFSSTMGIWGGRTPAANDASLTGPTSPVGRIKAVQSLGVKWMQAVSSEDARPRSSLFSEAQNTATLRASWNLAIQGGADIAQMTTWNDLPEGSQMEPSDLHGWSYLDISAYYIAWFKTGVAPTITKDAVYLSHRIQAAGATPSYPETQLMQSLKGGATSDKVEALTFLTAPARVTIQVGSNAYVCQAAAGMDTCLAPLGNGPVSVKVERNGVLVTGTTSSHPVTATPYVQNESYTNTSSLRTPTAGTNGLSVTSTTLISKTATAVADADSYTNSLAATSNNGTSSSLYAAGNPDLDSYVHFAVPAIPVGTTLTAATLTLTTTSDAKAGSVSPFTVGTSSNSWTESGVNYNNRPAITSTVLGTVPANTASSTAYTIPLSLTDLAPLTGSAATLTLSAPSSVTDNLIVYSHDYGVAGSRPTLTLTFTPTSTAPAAPAAQVVQTVSDVADSSINAAAPTTTNPGGALVARATATGTALIKFTLPAAPAGKTLKSAVLKAHTYTGPSAGSATPSTVQLAGSSWVESTVSWALAPAIQPATIGTVAGGTGVDEPFNTSLATSAISPLAGSTITVAITGTSGDSLWISSKEASDVASRPVLVLTWG